MENLALNMSLWGVVVVVFTALRLDWHVTIGGQLTGAASAADQWRQIVHDFFLRTYKPITIAALSVVALYFCQPFTLASNALYGQFWISATLAGGLSVGVGLLFKLGIRQYVPGLGDRRNPTSQTVAVWLGENAVNSTSTFLLSLLSLLIVFTTYGHQFSWEMFTVLSFVASFALGASIAWIGKQVYVSVARSFRNSQRQLSSDHAEATAGYSLLDGDRYDALTGALVAAMLLGTTFCNVSAFKTLWLSTGAVLLPVALAFSGVFISTAANTVLRFNKWHLDPAAYLIEKMLSALLMITAAYFITQYLLPVTWVCNGKEFTSMQVFYAAEAGILGGLLTNKVTQGYRVLHERYFTYLAAKSFHVSFLDSAFHRFISFVSLTLPVILIAVSILLSYYLVGLYGIVISLVAMLANLTTQLTAEE